MSIASPQNREEFKKYIRTRLGEPVLEVNIADEQMDIAINDAFQYYNERSHFYGTERMYLVFEVTNDFKNYWSSHELRGSEYTSTYMLNADDADGVMQTEQLEVPMMAESRNYLKGGYQNNFMVLPDDVVGVTDIFRGTGGMGGIGGGIIPPGMIAPIMLGGMLGDGCANGGFQLSSYFIMQGYLALIDFMMNPPIKYNWNQRTHRLHIDSDLSFAGVGQNICIECMVKPSPDLFPDLWNDMWLKEFATALTKALWGRNLTKYQQVQLPGGIVINGERILTDAQSELQQIKDRFAMDWADPPLDIVG